MTTKTLMPCLTMMKRKKKRIIKGSYLVLLQICSSRQIIIRTCLENQVWVEAVGKLWYYLNSGLTINLKKF
jgi:hypothetical protein